MLEYKLISFYHNFEVLVWWKGLQNGFIATQLQILPGARHLIVDFKNK